MTGSTRICKVCGKEYPYCKTELRDDIFRWQDVACCAEHGAEYFALVAASRGGKHPASPVVSNEDLFDDELLDDEDDFFDDDEEDDEDEEDIDI